MSFLCYNQTGIKSTVLHSSSTVNT